MPNRCSGCGPLRAHCRWLAPGAVCQCGISGPRPGVAFGTLSYIPSAELASASLGARTIVITDDVPNDIDFVGGLITETFQTPLAHVNILSQSRNTPNMALPKANYRRLNLYWGNWCVWRLTMAVTRCAQQNSQKPKRFGKTIPQAGQN